MLEWYRWEQSLSDEERRERREFRELWHEGGICPADMQRLYPSYTRLTVNDEEVFQKIGGLSGLLAALLWCPNCRKIAASWRCKCAKSPQANFGVPQPHPPFSVNPGATSQTRPPVSAMESIATKSPFS